MSDDNPFDILGISASAEPEVINAAYRALARKYHPDLNPDTPPGELNARMVKINWAKAELESNGDHWRRIASEAAKATQDTHARASSSQPRASRPRSEPKGAVSTDPQVLLLSGTRGASGTVFAWAHGLPPESVRARFQAGLIDVQRLPPAGERAAFAVKVQDDFASDIKDNLVLTIEFVATGYMGAKTFVSVAPLHEQVLAQRRGDPIAPARHVSESARLSFGRHRGRTFNEVALEEPGYLEWMLREGAGSHIERECARRALQLQFGGTWLPPPTSRRRRAKELAKPPLRQSVPALPDPNRPGGLLRLLKSMLGQKD